MTAKLTPPRAGVTYLAGNRRRVRASVIVVGMSHPFDSDTQVRPVGDNRFAATVTDRWNALGGGANGGYTLAICLQALRRDMPFPDPLVVSAFFLQRVTPGPAEVRTEIARSGRRVATGEARLLRDGKEAVRVMATFTDLDQATGRTLMLDEPPGLPPPEETVELVADGSMPGVTIADRVEYRGAALPGWRRGRPTGNPGMEFWMRFRGGREADV